MNTTVSIYDPATGVLTGVVFSGPSKAVSLNTPAGHAAIEGQHDHRYNRVVDGVVQEFVPDPPDADHEWDAQSKQFRLTDKASDIANADRAARVAIEQAESSSLRAMREALLLVLPESAEKTRLQTIDAAIAASRADIGADAPELKL